jgi:TolB protein
MSNRGRLAAGVALTVALLGAPSASATFRGANGLLAYEREAPAGDHTQADVYTIRPDGSQVTRLTATANRNEFGPTWNAAGTEIVMWRTAAPVGPGSIWVMDATGGNQRRLTSGFDARDPSWDASGTRIVFTRETGADSDLWTMQADGTDLHQLTSGTALDFEPSWSPDGSRIAFSRGSPTGDVGDIYVLTLKTGALLHLTHSPDYDHQVCWGPGSKRLVFERDYDASSSIFRINADGTGLTRLTRGQFFDISPAFSPDGTAVAFGSDRGGTLLDDLWTMSDDGAHESLVRHLANSEAFPDWQAYNGVT